MSEKELNGESETADWEPETVSLAEYVILNELCAGKRVMLDDSGIINFLKGKGVTPDAIASGLNKKHLVYQKGQQLFLLTDSCACIILPDGRYIAGENKTGRLERWVSQFTEKRQAGGSNNNAS